MLARARFEIATKERGSSTAEAAISLSLVALLVSGGLGIFYFAFAHVWADRAGYEAAVCLASTASDFECRARLENTLKGALPIGATGDVRLSRSSREARVNLEFKILDKSVVRIRKRLSLPLVAR